MPEIERKIYKTSSGASVEVLCREFAPGKKDASSTMKELIFLPGMGVEAESEAARNLGEVFARSSGSKTYLITSQVWEEIRDSLYEQARAIAAFIKEKGGAEVTLVGHSQGADKAIDLASILQKEREFTINGLVLLDAVGLYDQNPGDVAVNFFKDSMINTPPDLLSSGRDRLVVFKRGMLTVTEILFGLAKNIWHVWRTQPEYKRRIAAEIEEISRANPRVKEIEVPVVLISGAGDPISDPGRFSPPGSSSSATRPRHSDPRDEYLKQTLFPKSPYVRMIAPEKFGHHGLPFFRTESVANASLYFLSQVKRPY